MCQWKDYASVRNQIEDKRNEQKINVERWDTISRKILESKPR